MNSFVRVTSEHSHQNASRDAPFIQNMDLVQTIPVGAEGRSIDTAELVQVESDEPIPHSASVRQIGRT